MDDRQANPRGGIIISVGIQHSTRWSKLQLQEEQAPQYVHMYLVSWLRHQSHSSRASHPSVLSQEETLRFRVIVI